MQYATITLDTADQLFAEFSQAVTADVIHATETARDILDRTLRAVRLAKGRKASLNLNGALLCLLLADLGKSAPTIDTETLNAFRSTIAMVNRTGANNQATQWTGEAFLRIYRDVIHDIQGLAVQCRVTGQYPAAVALQTLSQIPRQLLLALGRLLADALPAIVNAADDKQEASNVAHSIISLANMAALTPTEAAHQCLQTERGQMQEMRAWSGQGGCLVGTLQSMLAVLGAIDTMTALFAPQSNSQSALVTAEAQHYFKNLQSTLAP